jgi:hypothetical protein
MSKIYHWTELQYAGNKPNLGMLIDKGCIIEHKCLLKKEPRGNGGQLRKVLFDKSYVDYWLVKMFIAFYPYSTVSFKALASVFLVALIKHLHEDIKVYKLHGHGVIRLDDLGIVSTAVGLSSLFEVDLNNEDDDND